LKVSAAGISSPGCGQYKTLTDWLSHLVYGEPCFESRQILDEISRGEGTEEVAIIGDADPE
jgi:hypothetical protein